MGAVEASASALIRACFNELVEDSMARQWARWPGLEASFAQHQLSRMKEDTRYHLEYLESSLWFGERVLLNDYAIWCKVLFANLNLPSEWFTGSVECIGAAVREALPEREADVADSYIREALASFEDAVSESSSFIVPGSALGVLARSYLTALIDGDRAHAVLMLNDAVEAGTPVRDIYMDVFQPVQREVGRLWHLNQVSVAQEHWITAATEVAMSRINDRLVAHARLDKTVLTACVGGEQHALGARMVSDFFEMDGWNARYLGANTPSAVVIEAVRDTRADVLALSATMTSHIETVAEIIDLLRADAELGTTPVIVGGYPFNLAPDLWERVGADGYAPDAQAAPALAAELTSC